MNTKIEYNTPNVETWAEGRNGMMIQTGIDIQTFTAAKTVILTPINTRGIGRGEMTIPTDRS